MVRLSHRTLPLLAASASLSHGRGLGWHFVQNGTTGVLALEAMVVSPNLAIIFDIASNDPLTVNGHPAWGALWNFETNTATALDVVSDSFCASGGFLSNGTMVSVGGNAPVIPEAEDGRQALRFFGPCSNPAGDGCPLIEDPVNLHLVEPRWYPSSLRIFDGSLMVVGGNREATFFYNTDPANSIEFFPPKDGGIPRYSPFLERTLPANMFPRTIALPDGRVFMASNNQTIIYDMEKNTELVLPDIPNGVRVTNPFDGTATLLPLSPPHYIPEVLICGGTNTSDKAPSESLSSQDPASSQCSRMTLTPAGIQKGWEIEYMLEPRMMPEMILLPNGQVLIVNGAQTGYAAYASVSDPIGNSNADHPAYTPSLYTPDARTGHRISNKGMPTSEIARVYHSVATLTPKGNIFIAGSNPNPDVVNTTRYNTEFRVEYLNPPYMTVARPRILNAPQKIPYNTQFTMSISVPPNLRTSNLKVALMDLGFSSHAFHSSSLLVFMEAQLSPDRRSLRIRSPPNNRIYPPGPAYIYVTIDDVSSEGVEVMMGTGASPPVPDQGVRL